MSGRRSTFGRSVTSRMFPWTIYYSGPCFQTRFLQWGLKLSWGLKQWGLKWGLKRKASTEARTLNHTTSPLQSLPSRPILLAHLFLSRPRSFGLARAETSHRDASARPRPKVPDELPCDVASRIPLLAFGSLFTQTRRPLTDTSCSTHNQDYSLNKIRSMASAERPTQ